MSKITTVKNQVVDTMKVEVVDGAWRSATEQAVEIVCEQTKKLLAKTVASSYVDLVLETRLGKGGLAWIVGNAILLSNNTNKNLQRLGKELRVFGYSNTFSVVFEMYVKPIMGQLLEVVSNLPELVEGE